MGCSWWSLKGAILGLGVMGWAATASAAIIWDYSPATTGASGEDSWSNNWWTYGHPGQNFVDQIAFATGATLTGMDIFGALPQPSVGDLAHIHIFVDNAGTPGALFSAFDEPLSAVDKVGTTGRENRLHVDFTNPVTLLANTTYWIGMSGKDYYWDAQRWMSVGAAFPQMGLAINAPGDGKMWQLAGDIPQGTGQVPLGDMAFRLSGTLGSGVPEPASLALAGLGLVALSLARRSPGRFVPATP